MKKPDGALVHVERKTGKDWPSPGGDYWLDADDLRQAVALPTDMLGGFLLARLRSDKREQLPGISAIHFAPGSEEAFLVDAKAWLAKFVDTPQVRTPLTREHLLRWAKDWVAKSPTHKESAGWDEAKATTIYKDLPNTPAYVLATILQRYAAAQYGDYGSSDARETILGLCWEGCKGYRHYTEQEALDEIVTELVDPENSPYEFTDLEDLLEELSPEDDD